MMTELKLRKGERTASAEKVAKAITTGEINGQKLRRLEALLETGKIASRLSGISTIVKLEDELKYYFIVHPNGKLDIVKTVIELDGFERSTIAVKTDEDDYAEMIVSDDKQVFEDEPVVVRKSNTRNDFIYRVKMTLVEYFDGPKVTKTLKRVR